MEKDSGVNLKAKSGDGVPEAVCVLLAIPATSLEPVVLALAFPLDYFLEKFIMRQSKMEQEIVLEALPVGNQVLGKSKGQIQIALPLMTKLD